MNGACEVGGTDGLEDHQAGNFTLGGYGSVKPPMPGMRVRTEYGRTEGGHGGSGDGCGAQSAWARGGGAEGRWRYPGTYATEELIRWREVGIAEVPVARAGTKLADDASVVTAGGCVLAVVAIGSTLADARALAYDNASRIEFEGKMLRTDIALREL